MAASLETPLTLSLVFAGSFSTSIMILNPTFTSMGMLDGYVVRYKR